MSRYLNFRSPRSIGRPLLISHFGLHYIHNMTADYAIPTGTTYVEGSARIVPGTGTANARPGASVTHDASGIHSGDGRDKLPR